jgi:translation elongation factor EF-G
MWGALPSAASNTHLTTRRPWFDHSMIACAIWRWRVSWKRNDIEDILYNIFDLFLNKEPHYGEPVHGILVALYKVSVMSDCTKYKYKIEIMPQSSGAFIESLDDCVYMQLQRNSAI